MRIIGLPSHRQLHKIVGATDEINGRRREQQRQADEQQIVPEHKNKALTEESVTEKS